MSEKIFHQHHELVDRAEALRYAQAVEEIGAPVVRIVQNEGETYTTENGRATRSVPEGNVRLSVSGMVPSGKGTEDFYDKVEELRQAEQKAA